MDWEQIFAKGLKTMSLLGKIKRKIIRVRKIRATFGYRVAFVIELLPRLTPKGLEHKFLLNKHAFLSKYIAIRYASVIETLLKTRGQSNQYDLQADRHCDGQCIWVFWWQGELKMPPLVRACYSSIRRQAPNEDLVTLLTRDNIADFINLPKYILDKVENGAISLAHLSDIIRVGILFQRGGLWIDATVFVSKPITYDMLSAEFFTLRPPYSVENISYGRWTIFVIGARQGSSVFQLLQSLLFAYWEKENIPIDYFLLDYMLAIAYNKFAEARRMIDLGSVEGREIFELALCLNQGFDHNAFSRLANKITFHKLSRKLAWRLTTPGGTETVYAHIVRRSEP